MIVGFVTGGNSEKLDFKDYKLKVEEKLKVIISKNENVDFDKTQCFCFAYDMKVYFVDVRYKGEVESLLNIINFIDEYFCQDDSKKLTREKDNSFFGRHL